MNKYFSRLNPSERRFVVGVGLAFFLVINIFWVWPHFSDWGKLQRRLNAARAKLAEYQTAINQSDRLKSDLARLESEGANVPAEDQRTEFMRTIQLQAQQTGVGVSSFGHQTTRTNQFFSEQSQTIAAMSGEKQLVDFLYNLGSGNSQIRIRALSVRPDQQRQQLNANITLVASYRKGRNPGTAPAAARAASAKAAPASLKPPASPAKSAPPVAKPAERKPEPPKKK